MKYTYPIIIEFDKEEKAPDYLVSLPDFDKMTQAESIADAIEMDPIKANFCLARTRPQGW